MRTASRDDPDSTAGRPRPAVSAVAILVAAVLVATGLFGVSVAAAAAGRGLAPPAITVGAPSEKPCERGLRGAASLCQLLSAALWDGADGAFDRACEPIVLPAPPAELGRTGEWRGAPPFRPPRSST